MNWGQLLSLKRYGDTEKRERHKQDETRMGFDVDYDRILFSSPFRSLQDKTQVMPLPVNMAAKKNFVHSRLTHSLEVSVVARSLGRRVGLQILHKYPELANQGFHFNDFGAITAAASLAHDIGNPPFGHSGEKAIGSYFKNGNGNRFKSELSTKQYQDLAEFEGNANGFKLLVESKAGIPGGNRLSYATLGAFLKYPKASFPKKPTSDVSDKKFGFFQSQQEFFLELAEDLGLERKSGEGIRYRRHPLAFLVEAADDICYTIIDFEDGINLGLISEDYALEYLINLVKDTINIKKFNQIKGGQERLAYLRAMAIGNLINDTCSIFLSNEEEILKGDFEVSLLKHSKYKAQTDDIIKLCIDKVYRSDEVVEKELAGYRILKNLLDASTNTLMNFSNEETNQYDELLLQTLGLEPLGKDCSTYDILLTAATFVAGLSDSAAVHLNGMISGNRI
ncbi:dGTP triphosphohydrolase [Croceivirga thetidis]|uniref:DNTP triphosphohydrolase n=1 Tax=Croceivirga thetidis TaxID=2721623 RepID=A0ABX1GM49_9FLAO|nr:dNTP triphosphohydrolase [Croceivirga thetidis]NKI30997.1 dNTP triphosphohydrolase [Croceivirga thetidis]